MPDFSDIAVEYDKIKDTPDAIGYTRTNESSKDTGPSADIHDTRQEILPDEETHYRLQQKLSTMFDKSSRAGAKSSLHGLILPNGRKVFSEFHDKYTGTGRYEPQKTPDKVLFPENAPKVDPYPNKVILFERCVQCAVRVDLENFIPGMTFIPPEEHLATVTKDKWSSVDIKPQTIICYLSCMNCPQQTAVEVKKIRHDAVKSQLIVATDPSGRPITLADREAQAYLKEVSEKVSDNIFQMIKNERQNPDSTVFYGNAQIT